MSLEQEPQEDLTPFSQEEEHSPAESNPETNVEAGEGGRDFPTNDGENDPKGRGYTPEFDAFKKAFDEQAHPEKKLQLAIDFMEASLAQGKAPHFRSFWEARRLCLPLFKENIPAANRGQLWIKCSDLSKEARRLKEILDEQSAFAVEQIEMAIQGLEKDIAEFDSLVQKTKFNETVVFPHALKGKEASYQQVQKQLDLLNAQASRINALRKELLKTDMRVRNKNKFFQRLSTLGDQVFPRRKESIAQISQQFSDEVNAFIEKHFDKTSPVPFYHLREEIKLWQGLAKILTLNTQTFTQTRARLSACWDQIKEGEKARKQERAEKKGIYKQNFDEIEKQIQHLNEALEKGEESLNEAQKKVEGIAIQMKKLELGREELAVLRESLGHVRATIHDRNKTQAEIRQAQEHEKEKKKREQYRALIDRANALIQGEDSLDADQFAASRDALAEEVQQASLSKSEKMELERSLKLLRDLVIDKQEKAQLLLSEDDRQGLQQLKAVLEQRKERRHAIKQQLEVLRKASGSSGLDFEKAMNFKSQINEEKERLEKANQAIEEIEQKIAQLQKKLRKTN